MHTNTRCEHNSETVKTSYMFRLMAVAIIRLIMKIRKRKHLQLHLSDFPFYDSLNM